MRDRNIKTHSIGSSGRVEGGKKHEIYVAALAAIFFMTCLYRTGGGIPPSAPPWIRYWHNTCTKGQKFQEQIRKSSTEATKVKVKFSLVLLPVASPDMKTLMFSRIMTKY